MAADYIRSHDRTPVYRCDREGKPNPKAKFWKSGYGSLVLTEDALIAKAERQGWKSDAWQAIACCCPAGISPLPPPILNSHWTHLPAYVPNRPKPTKPKIAQ